MYFRSISYKYPYSLLGNESAIYIAKSIVHVGTYHIFKENPIDM